MNASDQKMWEARHKVFPPAKLDQSPNRWNGCKNSMTEQQRQEWLDNYQSKAWESPEYRDEEDDEGGGPDAPDYPEGDFEWNGDICQV